MNTLTIKSATLAVGGLSAPSKMPTFGISLPATACKVGAKLRKIPGSVCSKCYAHKRTYTFPVVKTALANRLKVLTSPEWISNMVFLLKNKKKIVESGLFRWHDSGDIQSLEHFTNIVEIAKQTPTIIHWLPTKEKGIIAKFKRNNTIPVNLIIRLSGTMINGKAPKSDFTSTVTTDPEKATCRAFENGGECGSCRKCWDFNVKNVVYLTH